MDHSSWLPEERCRSVKALHSQRAAVKERLMQKQVQQRQQQRATRVSGLREGEFREEVAGTIASSSSVTDPSARISQLEWQTLGRELGCDMANPEIMNYLLELEEEIRQEQLFAMYDECNDGLEEYYASLMS